jgi:hypothetical protein
MERVEGGAMRRLVMLMRFRDQATPPSGDPVSFSVRGESEQIVLLDGDGGTLPERAAYETKVVMTGEVSFVEDGTMTFGDADSLRFTTVGEGILGPSPEEGVLQGSVIWRVEEGEGRFAGATGLVTSSFEVQADSGQANEHQVLALYLL